MKVSQKPVFIVGCPRSGTTLLQTFLATQPNTVSLPETHFFEIFDSRDHEVRPEDWQTSIELFELKNGHPFLMNLSHTLSFNPIANHEDWKKALFEELLFEQFKRHIPVATIPSLRWIEKTPYHVFHLPVINKMFPDATFVNIVRDPRAAVFSMQSKLPLGGDMRIQDLAALWKSAVVAFDKFSGEAPQQCITVKYEDLVQDSVSVLRRVCKFAEIDFEESHLEMRSQIASEVRHSTEHWKDDVAKRPILSTNHQYRSQLSLKSLLQIQRIAACQMQLHKYRVEWRILQTSYGMLQEVRAKLKGNQRIETNRSAVDCEESGR
jgi:hypothetical protein